MNHLQRLTERYVQLFNAKDIPGLRNLFDDAIHLTDPGVDAAGKEKVVSAVRELFDSVNHIDFTAHKIYTSGNTSIIEFCLQLGKDKFVGVDILEWKDEKITGLRAYLYKLK